MTKNIFFLLCFFLCSSTHGMRLAEAFSTPEELLQEICMGSSEISLLERLKAQGVDFERCVEYERESTPLIIAVRHRNMPVVKELLEKYLVNIHTVDNFGLMAVHYAIADTANDGFFWHDRKTKYEIFEFLLRRGADVHAQVRYAEKVYSTLDMAMSCKDEYMCDLLIQKGVTEIHANLVGDCIEPKVFQKIAEKIRAKQQPLLAPVYQEVYAQLE